MDEFKLVHFVKNEPSQDGFNNEYVVIMFADDDAAEHTRPGFDVKQEVFIDGDATTFPVGSTLTPSM